MRVKMRFSLTAGLCLAALAAVAEFQVKPDGNTLWREDGRNVTTCDRASKGWLKSLKMTPREAGGLWIEPAAPKSRSSGRDVPFSRDYPYLEFDLEEVEVGTGYQAFTFWQQPGGKPTGCVLLPPAGIYTIDLYRVSRLPDRGSGFLRVDVYGQKLGLRYVQAVKKPENFIRFGENGKITVQLKDPAEDVTLRFLDSYYCKEILVDGKTIWQLTPEDEAAQLWSVTVAPEILERLKLRGDLMAKAVILGGKIKKPLIAFYPKETKKK